jgi:hypothetical protein
MKELTLKLGRRAGHAQLPSHSTPWLTNWHPMERKAAATPLQDCEGKEKRRMVNLHSNLKLHRTKPVKQCDSMVAGIAV